MLSYLTDDFYNWTRKVCRNALLKVLAAGPVPHHIAFVMDGNRRYARMNHKLAQQGHTDGYETLTKMLEVCYYLNIKCVSAYAFSIENFKRDPEEVNALMRLAAEKLGQLSQHGSLLDQYGVRLNIVGRKDMLPEDVQVAARQVEDMTRHNTRAILNLCMPYTSRDEMTTAVQSAVRNALKSDPPNLEITEKDIDAEMLTNLAGSPPVDVLIRTSGVKRLSDFMLWQSCEDTQLHFTPTYWPDFGLTEFIPMILDYQRKAWARSSS
ncbi:hypothetical protein PLEOSDRAFT_1075531 [Pleurotus ostreatus PC15]|uniref:Alkyl transferase n=1 Tax=Pleurotus ostreatus (strain PC15) TaxID=1137138 RepID=A0A067P4X4_PLEO1|nr:hypothetical protein PLEOSDRAFT_1075531 [Pleurotus ostreatus PC15]